MLGAGLPGSRLANGIRPSELTAAQTQALANGAVLYLLAGAAVGTVARLLERSAQESDALVAETMEARERAARLDSGSAASVQAAANGAVVVAG